MFDDKSIGPDTVGWFFRLAKGPDLGGPFATKAAAVAAGIKNESVKKAKKFWVESKHPEGFDFESLCYMDDILLAHANQQNWDDRAPDLVYSGIDKTIKCNVDEDEKLRAFFKEMVEQHGLWAWAGEWPDAPIESYEIPVVRKTSTKKVVKEVKATEYKAGKAKVVKAA